jgi:hypothetical protein
MAATRKGSILTDDLGGCCDASRLGMSGTTHALILINRQSSGE